MFIMRGSSKYQLRSDERIPYFRLDFEYDLGGTSYA